MSTFGYIITTLGAVVVAVCTMLGSIRVAHESRRAATRATEVTAEDNMVDQALRMASDYRQDRDDMRARLDKIEAKVEEQGEQLKQERLRREGLARELDRKEERLTALERRFRAAVAYIQALLDLLRSHQIEAPTPPEGINITD